MNSFYRSTAMPAMPEVLSDTPTTFVGARLLQVFYARAGMPMPEIYPLPPQAVPEPYHTLLVHSNDMTPSLERYFGQRVQVQVQTRFREAHYYFRQVVLVEAHNQRPVEFGVIRIDLSLFGTTSRQSVLEEHNPLGRILQEDAIAHTSWPQAFFQTTSDAHLQRLLRIKSPSVLFGRRNLLLNGDRRVLADVLEILPPLLGSHPDDVARTESMD